LLIRIFTVNVRDKVGVEKYLRKNCYHRIEYSALFVPTHRGPMRVSNETNTQVVTWTIDKWMTKIIQREIYNVRDP